MSAVKNLSRRGLILLLAMWLSMGRFPVFAAEGRELSCAEFLALADQNGVITLNEDVTLTERLEITSHLTLAAGDGVTLTLPWCDDDLVGSSIQVSQGGKLIIEGGGSVVSLGPVLIYANGGEVEVNGCSLRAVCTALQIQGGKAAVNGGRLTAGNGPYYQTVYVDHGEFTLNDGVIENTAYGGGAITVYNGAFPHGKSTVEICGGTVVNSGGGAAALSVEGESDIRVQGGTLTNSGANAAALLIAHKANVRIDGGNLENTEPDTDSVAVFEYDQSGESTITINGGSFTSQNGRTIQIVYGKGSAGGSANITGAVFGNAVDAGDFTLGDVSDANAAKLSEDGRTVELTGGAPHNTAHVYAASYENGRMTGIVSGELVGDKITFNGKAAKGDQLFLLDEDYAPACSKMTIE